MIYTKIITFYLPQFHEVEENNNWWGQGFTEWENVKTARPLYKKHYQPKIPYMENYYDLSDSEVLKSQADLANNYGIDGFCFYHYWFQGKLLLEKPIEILLKHQEIKIEYCLSWANETWSRRWNGQEKEILIRQEYGGIDDWKEHIDYLIPFFRDARYIKINNKPVFLLYRAFEIKYCDDMIKYWNERLCKEGFAGIYIIETLNSQQKSGYAVESSAYVEFEPMYTINKYLNFGSRMYRYLFSHLGLSKIGFKDFLSYDRIWNCILRRNRKLEKKVFLGAFPEWDNTARKGKAGLVIKGSSPQKFYRYLLAQYQESVRSNNEFIFINAWNEWGEGAYLEADEKYKYEYLDAVKSVKERVHLNEDS